MSLQDDNQDRRRRRNGPVADADAADQLSSRRKRQTGGEVGSALRAAYQRMVDEDIPPEMLDLLGKLG